MELSIDIETYSDISLKDCGVYKYVDSPNFEILLFGYAFDDEEVKVIDLASDERIPGEIIKALYNTEIIKCAFNAAFERTCLTKHLKKNGLMPLKPEGWSCTMVKSLTLGLPRSLDKVSKMLRFEEDKQKMNEGKALIRYFSIPCKPTKVNGGRTRNLPEHDPEKWNTFKTYNAQDVVVERAIRKKLDRYKTTDTEQRLWELDQEINDRGINTDYDLIEQAITCDTAYEESLTDEYKKITGLDNPNSLTKLKKWIKGATGVEVKSITKQTIPELLKKANNEDVKRVLEIRQRLGKTSVSKYQKMKDMACHDGRIRGFLQFYGAGRTGRWAGRGVQPQNLPQNHLPDLDDARNLIKEGKFTEVEFLFDSIPDTLSQLIRTAFIPTRGNRFIVSDFSAIEARVIAWYAGEKWRLEVFQTHGKIYEASASQMFKVPMESIHKGDPLRQKGKIAELALGYGGSVGALKSMDKKGDIPEDELPGLVKDWRAANPRITKFWWDVDKAAKKAIRERTTVNLQYGLKFIYDPGVLFIQLPSGRKIAYIRPKIEIGKFDKPTIFYDGNEPEKDNKNQWKRLETYGPKLVENIVQATARDCLGEAMFRVTKAGYDIVMHIHDELVLDVPKGFGSIEEVTNIFGEPIDWAPGLLLKADGYECNYYQKD